MSEQPAEPEVWLTMDDWAQRCGFSEASGRRTVASWLQRRWPRNNPIPPPDDVVVEKGARPAAVAGVDIRGVGGAPPGQESYGRARVAVIGDAVWRRSTVRRFPPGRLIG